MHPSIRTCALAALLPLAAVPTLSAAQVSSIPGYTLLYTLSIPTNGTSNFTGALAAGVNYKLVAYGTFNIGGYQADAEYIWGGSIPGTHDHCVFGGLATCDYGIAINDTTVGGYKGVSWGAYRADHTYQIDYLGAGQAIRLTYHDDNLADNLTPLSLQVFAPSAVPEPATAVMLLAGLGWVAARRRVPAQG